MGSRGNAKSLLWLNSPPDKSTGYTRWPTDHKHVTQAFGQNPKLYARYRIPAHNGVDIMAPEGSKIYAVRPGKVIYTGPLNSNGALSGYGYHVRVISGDYIYIYAHLKPNFSVKSGDEISGGAVLGVSGNGKETEAENSTGPHLHFEKRHRVASLGLTGWPWGILDPSEDLKKIYNDRRLSVPYATGVPGGKVISPIKQSNALIGVHLSADGHDLSDDKEMVKAMRPEIVKILSNHRPEDLARMVQLAPDAVWVIRAFLDFYDEKLARGRRVSASQFVADTINDTGRSVQILRQAGVPDSKIYIEIHNEPNLTTEGFGASWSHGGAFATWFMQVMREYKYAFQNIKIWISGDVARPSRRCAAD